MNTARVDVVDSTSVFEIQRDIRDAKKSVCLADYAICLYPTLDVLYSEKRKKGTFYHNRVNILDAFKQNRLYVIDMAGTGKSGERLRQWLLDKYDSQYYVPAFCVLSIDQKAVEYVWVHEPLRGFGLGRLFVEELKPRRANDVLEQSIGFWNKMNIEYDVYRPPKVPRKRKRFTST